MIGKFPGHVGMKAQLVTDVGKVRLPGADGLDHLQSFREVKVRNVLLALQGVKYQHFRALQFLDGLGWDVFGVCDIAERIDPESHHGKLEVHHRQGKKGNAVDVEWRFVIYSVKVQPRDAGVRLVNKSIGVFNPQLIQHLLAAIDGYLGLLQVIKGPDIVKPGRMVAMGMGKDHRVYTLYLRAQHLLAKVGAGVNDKRLPPGLQQHGCPQPLVAKIDGAAHFAGAANHGHTLRGSGAQECYFQAAADCCVSS